MKNINITLLIPVFNDWEAVLALLELLDAAMKPSSMDNSLRVILIDDGSTVLPGPLWSKISYSNLSAVDILSMRCNLGHQRAIAIGLAYIEKHIPCDAVAVMDGDGEDKPEDIPLLIASFRKNGGTRAIFAQRTRRTERLSFQLFYRLYKSVHWVLTGQKVQVGNFSILPFALLRQLVVVSDLWNHYAAAAIKSRLPIEMLPLARGRRLAGESRMNFVSLVVHGLSAMSVYGERIGVRALTLTGIATACVIAMLIAALTFRLITSYEFPRWMVAAAAALLVILFQTLALTLVFVFITLANRDRNSFLPTRDFEYYVNCLTTITPPPGV